jgi:hypothetical protein
LFRQGALDDAAPIQFRLDRGVVFGRWGGMGRASFEPVKALFGCTKGLAGWAGRVTPRTERAVVS